MGQWDRLSVRRRSVGLSTPSRRRFLATCASLLVAALVIRPAAAVEIGDDLDMTAIQQRLDEQDIELRRLRAELEMLSAPLDEGLQGSDLMSAPYAPTYLAAEPEGTKPPGKENAKPAPAPVAKPAPPPFPLIKMTGFMHLDAGWFSQSANNQATVGDMQDGAGFRRARLAAVGQVAEFTNYQLEMDFAVAGRPSFMDVWVEQTNLPVLGGVRIGQFRQPFSADALTSIKALPFLERSLPFQAFVPFRRTGVMASDMSEDQMTQWGYSVYRSGAFLNNAPIGDTRFGTDIGDIGGYSLSGRISHCMYYDQPTEGRYLWTLGTSYAFTDLGADDAAASGLVGNAGSGNRPFYQARAIPEFFLGYPELPQGPFGPTNTAVNGTPFFIDSGRYLANNVNLWGLESIYQAGALTLQGEWIGTMVNSVGAGNVFYNGAYVHALYRLTGEHRVYDPKSGTVKNVVPYEEFFSLRPGGVKGWGAWEIGTRWSYVNIQNPAGLTYINNTSAAGNGDLNNITTGLTWFWNPGARWQFAWIHSMLDNNARGFSDAELFVTRMQFEF